MKGLDYTALTVAIIGAVNWGLIGFFRLDLVALVFGNMTWLSRIIYAAGDGGGRIEAARKRAPRCQGLSKESSGGNTGPLF